MLVGKIKEFIELAITVGIPITQVKTIMPFINFKRDACPGSAVWGPRIPTGMFSDGYIH